MFNWKKDVVLDLYTARAEIYEFSQLKKASSMKPEWWKSLPNESYLRGFPRSTMKGCAGFNDFFSKAIIIPMWNDIGIRFTGQDAPEQLHEYFYPSNDVALVSQHPSDQRGGYLPENKWEHCKISSPWLAKCSHDIDFLMTNPGWHQEDPSERYTPNGIVNFKKQTAMAVNILFKRAEVGISERLLRADEPLAYLVPLTDRKVILKHHLISAEDYTNAARGKLSFRHFNYGYYKDAKCPFRRE